MRQHLCILLILMVFSAPSTVLLSAELKVEPDEKCVVTNRMVGRWSLHTALTARLRGEELDVALAKYRFVEFKLDPTALEGLPEEVKKRVLAEVAEKQIRIYASGKMTTPRGEGVFLIVANAGGTSLVVLPRREGGAGDDYPIVVAVAADSQNDLLFIGGHTSGAPFRAYERAKGEKKP